MIEFLGFAAGTLTTLAFIPQTVKSWRTRSVNDLSLTMLTAFNLGVGLWLLYGLALGALPVILANLATLCCSLTLLGLKLTTRRRPD